MRDDTSKMTPAELNNYHTTKKQIADMFETLRKIKESKKIIMIKEKTAIKCGKCKYLGSSDYLLNPCSKLSSENKIVYRTRDYKGCEHFIKVMTLEEIMRHEIMLKQRKNEEIAASKPKKQRKKRTKKNGEPNNENQDNANERKDENGERAHQIEKKPIENSSATRKRTRKTILSCSKKDGKEIR